MILINNHQHHHHRDDRRIIVGWNHGVFVYVSYISLQNGYAHSHQTYIIIEIDIYSFYHSFWFHSTIVFAYYIRLNVIRLLYMCAFFSFHMVSRLDNATHTHSHTGHTQTKWTVDELSDNRFSEYHIHTYTQTKNSSNHGI